MATSSINRNIVFTNEEEVNVFVKALEEAKAEGKHIRKDVNKTMSKDEMIKYFGEGN